MIKVKKDKVKIKVPKDMDTEAFLMTELSVAVINVADYLKKDIKETLYSLNWCVLFAMDIEEIIEEFKEELNG